MIWYDLIWCNLTWNELITTKLALMKFTVARLLSYPFKTRFLFQKVPFSPLQVDQQVSMLISSNFNHYANAADQSTNMINYFMRSNSPHSPLGSSMASYFNINSQSPISNSPGLNLNVPQQVFTVRQRGCLLVFLKIVNYKLFWQRTKSSSFWFVSIPSNLFLIKFPLGIFTISERIRLTRNFVSNGRRVEFGQWSNQGNNNNENLFVAL